MNVSFNNLNEITDLKTQKKIIIKDSNQYFDFETGELKDYSASLKTKDEYIVNYNYSIFDIDSDTENKFENDQFERENNIGGIRLFESNFGNIYLFIPFCPLTLLYKKL